MPRMTRVRKVFRRVAVPGWSDRGAVAVIVSVLLASGVLLGMAALSVDVGQLMSEREELMSAADGAAQSIVIDCAKSAANCSTSDALAATVTRAGVIANANGKDGNNAVTYVCGRGGALGPCDPAKEPTNITACLNAPPAGINYVEVHTATKTKTSTVLPTAFAGTFVAGYKGDTVGACSRVEWGAPAGGISLTISLCEWKAATAGGTTFATNPPDPASEQILYLKTSSKVTGTCPADPAGKDGPGAFGWLPDDDGNCLISIAPGGTYPVDTGSSPTADCKAAIAAAQVSRLPQMIPIYDDLVGPVGSGSTGKYTLAGMAAFVVTGYYLPGKKGDKSVPSWLTGADPCSGGDRCVYGYFTAPLSYDGTVSAVPDLGPTNIKTVG